MSSLWLKKEHQIRLFEWQGGYACFSVSESNLEQVKKYIANQAQHHKKINFQDELRLFALSGMNVIFGSDATALRLILFVSQDPNVAFGNVGLWASIASRLL